MTLAQAGLLLIIFLFLASIVVLIFYRGNRRQRMRIHLAAWRTGVRDKGNTGLATGNHTWVHTFCLTRVRIGIERKTDERVQYCWRCEKVLHRLQGNNHKGAPEPTDPDRKVISLADFKK